MKKNILRYSKYLILAALMYFPIFGHLDTLPIRIWDEARLSINAYEMTKNGDMIVTSFDGTPDMWNTKPPLMIWSQAFFMKLIGVNELSVRLPSAIAAFLTCILLLFVSIKYLNNFWLGFITVLVLITSHGYINLHVTRTGDYDALLTLFTASCCVFFFLFIETSKGRYLYLFFVTLSLAVLTKSIAGMFFIPALIIYAVAQKKMRYIIRNKHFYAGMGIFLFLVVGYYLLREYKNSGYLPAVQKNELGGRYLNVIEEHKASFWYYYRNFIDFQLSAWYIWVPGGFLLGLFHKEKKIFRLTVFLILLLTTYFIVISAAQTKLEWYDAPMYPFLSMIIAICIYSIFNYLKKKAFLQKYVKYNIFPFIFLGVIYLKPYIKIFNKTFLPKEYSWEKEFYSVGYFLQDAVKGKYNIDGHYLLHDGYNAHNMFYVKILNDQGNTIAFKDWKSLEKDDLVIAHQQEVKSYIQDHYLYEIQNTIDNITIFEIYGKKSGY